MIPGVLDGSAFLGLDHADRAVALALVKQLNGKYQRNQLRRRYLQGHNQLKDLGISIPPQLRNVEVVVGWPAKAISAFASRINFQGLTSTSGSTIMNAFLAELWESNRLAVEAPAAHTSALSHSVAFVFVSKGRPEFHEPEIIISAKSAEDATGIWDARRRCLTSALSVDARDDHGNATLIHLYLLGEHGAPSRVLQLAPNPHGAWEAVEVSVFFGHLPVEPIPFAPTLDRPFGRSRITRGVMYYTDAGMRTMLRTEVGAEFFNAPQRYALGADEDAFTDGSGNEVPAWTVMLGRLLTLSRDEEGDLPQVGQFAQQSMVPNIDQLKSIAQMFASETSLDVGSLGIVQDNPSSAEAIRARNEELGVQIEDWRRAVLGPTWRRISGHAARMVDGGAALEQEISTVAAQFGSWSTPSEISQAQASIARVQAVPRLAETSVELERMGYSPDEIARIQSEWRKGEGRGVLEALRGAPPVTEEPVEEV